MRALPSLFVRTACGGLLLLTLAACAELAARPAPVSPCAVHEASYDCQVRRYHDVNAH